MNKLSDDLSWRGLVKDKTFADITWIDQPKKFYFGVDASSDSLTIGNLAAVLLAKRFIDAGWEAVILAGGATSLVGDPGGKDSERELKPKEEIAKNIEAIKSQLQRILSESPHEIVNNLDWLGEVKFLDFLRDVGKNYSMTELLQRDFVSARIGDQGTGISYAEFSYSLLQGYDFWHLYKTKQVVLQIGASDQWGNMLSGVPLIRKKENAEVHALSMPLVINKETGKKFGKSEAGAIWLDPAKTSPRDFYQFWINVADSDVEEYLKTFTLLSQEEIEDTMSQHYQDASKRIAQKRLALEVTTIVHGQAEAKQSADQADALKSPDFESAEFVELQDGISLIEALRKTKLVESNSEARRLIEEGAVYLNNEATKTEALHKKDYENNKLTLRKGKKYQNTVFVELV